MDDRTPRGHCMCDNVRRPAQSLSRFSVPHGDQKVALVGDPEAGRQEGFLVGPKAGEDDFLFATSKKRAIRDQSIVLEASFVASEWDNGLDRNALGQGLLRENLVRSDCQ